MKVAVGQVWEYLPGKNSWLICEIKGPQVSLKKLANSGSLYIDGKVKVGQFSTVLYDIDAIEGLNCWKFQKVDNIAMILYGT